MAETGSKRGHVANAGRKKWHEEDSQNRKISAFHGKNEVEGLEA